MGTYYRVLAYCDPQPPLAEVEQILEHQLAELNATFSNYDDTSELAQFNRASTQTWQRLSPELLTVLGVALQVFRDSEGALDVSVAPLVAAWGFGPKASVDLPPSDAVLTEVRVRVGLQFLELNETDSSARKRRDLELDLSALAKGYAVDSLSETLTSLGCPNHLVDIGGEVRAIGVKPSGQQWRIGIEIPNDDQLGGVARALPLRDQAVATSGDYRNFVAQDKARWSHSIDPRTGRPVSHLLASVTVVLPTTMLADAWATAFTVMGADAALVYAEQQNWPVLTIERRKAASTAPQASSAPQGQILDERFEIRYTRAMSTLLSPVNEGQP